jgi:hypothetical protein
MPSERLREILERYGTEPHEREVGRVRAACVKLAEGDEAKLEYFVSVAKRDYRDVLFWSDNPQEAKLTPEKRRRMREALAKLGIEAPPGLEE